MSRSIPKGTYGGERGRHGKQSYTSYLIGLTSFSNGLRENHYRLVHILGFTCYLCGARL